MRLIKLAAAVLNQTPLDWDNNERNIRQALEAARSAGAALVCLPEMCLTGYGCEDAFQSPGVQRSALRMLKRLMPETRGLAACFGLPLLYNKALFNTACLVVDGELLGFVAKRFLCGDGIHYEPRWFKPWQRGHQADLLLDDGDGWRATSVIGDIHFDLGGIKIGFEICEDAWVAERPGAELSEQGVDIILNPSASHFAFGKTAVRERFVLEGSRVFGCAYVLANLLGNESGRAIYDGGALIASGGRIVARGPRFSFHDWIVTTAVVDVDANRMLQSRLTSFEPVLDHDGGSVFTPFQLPAARHEPAAAELTGWERGRFVKEEEFARAVALALFDYLRKSRSSGFVVSMSGGADSAAVACLVALAIALSRRELGPAGFAKKLGRPGPQRMDGAWQAGADVSPFPISDLAGFLTCVYQATSHSSKTTREAARRVARSIGAEFLEFDVEELVQDYVEMVAKAVGRPLTWKQDDLALQNIQARTRSPGAWMLANLRNGLLLSTSNRSEAAVGYATMDGDTSGGLSPIAGIDKAFLRQWLVWLEQHGPEGIGTIPALAAVNIQAPTAELRPPEMSQTDEADLMPYDLLDAIERAAIRDKLTPVEVFQAMGPEFGQYSPEQLGRWIERFFVLFARNQWKRERYAPSFHVDDENLDPKTWCRFPILSGGFARELGELREHIARVSEVSASGGGAVKMRRTSQVTAKRPTQRVGRNGRRR